MRVVVNSGNIGTPVAMQLAKEGHEVSLTVQKHKPDKQWDVLRIRQTPFDINDSKSMESALRGVDAFFSLTPLVQNLVESGISAVQAAKRAGIKRIVRSSALGAGPEGIQLGRWHYEVEKAVEASGIPFTILKPINFMQNYLAYGIPETIKSQNAFYSSIGSAKVSYIDTRDISAVAAKCLTEGGHEGKHYELTGPEALSNEQIAELISQAVGRNIQYVGVPEAAATDSMTKAGMPPWLVTMLTELNATVRAGYLADPKTDIETVLKRKPIAFGQFVRDHLDHFKV